MPDTLKRIIWSVSMWRDAAATHRGRQLNRRRYGRDYQALLPVLRERMRWTPEQMTAHVDERVGQIIQMAALHVPYYRKLFAEHRIDPKTIRCAADLQWLPILEKNSFRLTPEEFIDERVPRRTLLWSSTSGTTGTPLRIAATRKVHQQHYAFFEVRHRAIAGIEFGKRPYAMIGGQLITPASRMRPPFWCYNRIHQQLYMSSFHLSNANLPSYVAELRRRPYHAIMGFPSSLYAIARCIIDNGLPPLSIPIASTSSEMLTERHRSAFRQAFGARTFDQYGCAEMCVLAAETPAGEMLISPDYAVLEVVGPDGRPAGPGQTGDVLCTGLVNDVQPLIRYRIGDRLAEGGPSREYPAFPTIERLDGRLEMVLEMRDGRRIGALDMVMEGVDGVRECQIVQVDWERFRLRVVPGNGYSDAGAAMMIRRLRERVGDVQVEIELVDEIARTAGGKFEAVVSLIKNARRQNDLTPHTSAAMISDRGSRGSRPMLDVARQLVWSMPALRDAAASIRGRQLHRERYGRSYSAALPVLRERMAWPAERMQALVNERLRNLIATASTHVCHYREAFAKHHIRADDIRGVADLGRLPLLEKSELRAAPERLLDDRLPPNALIWTNTSGTTGTPLRIASTTDVTQEHYAYFEVRHREPAGFQFGRLPYAMLGGQLVAPVSRAKPPFWCYNHVHKQLYLSSYHLSEANLPFYLEELRRRPYHALMGYPSSVHALARFILDHGAAPLSIPIISTSSETLFEHQRTAIEAAFGGRVHDQYGCAEMCVFAAQNAAGEMVISPDYGIVEVLGPNGETLPPGEIGEIVCTGLLNHAQPLIRYRIGDRGALGPPSRTHPAFPTLLRLEGRVDKVLQMRDGRRIGRLDPVFKGVEGVKECQIVQADWEVFRLRIVRGPGYTDASGVQLAENLRARVGPVKVDIVLERTIERSANGKFEAVVSLLNGSNGSVTTNR